MIGRGTWHRFSGTGTTTCIITDIITIKFVIMIITGLPATIAHGTVTGIKRAIMIGVIAGFIGGTAICISVMIMIDVIAGVDAEGSVMLQLEMF